MHGFKSCLAVLLIVFVVGFLFVWFCCGLLPHRFRWLVCLRFCGLVV